VNLYNFGLTALSRPMVRRNRVDTAAPRMRQGYLHFGVSRHSEAVQAVGDDSQACRD
jgi:hypothetical protein